MPWITKCFTELGWPQLHSVQFDQVLSHFYTLFTVQCRILSRLENFQNVFYRQDKLRIQSKQFLVMKRLKKNINKVKEEEYFSIFSLIHSKSY